MTSLKGDRIHIPALYATHSISHVGNLQEEEINASLLYGNHHCWQFTASLSQIHLPHQGHSSKLRVVLKTSLRFQLEAVGESHF